MSELINFRDFGGLPTRDGRRVKKGHFYRSGSYRDLTEEDVFFLKELEIDHLFDYRESSELDKEERHDEFAKHVHRISASEYLGGFDKEEKPVTLDMQAMIDFYQQIPFSNPAYRNMFDVLKKEDKAIKLLHNCTAGKDRTGLASALILKALDVHEDAIMMDYLQSMNAYEQILENEYRRLNGQTEDVLLRKLAGLVVMPQYLEASFSIILEKYGDFDRYFEEEFDLTQEDRGRLKFLYLENES